MSTSVHSRNGRTPFWGGPRLGPYRTRRALPLALCVHLAPLASAALGEREDDPVLDPVLDAQVARVHLEAPLPREQRVDDADRAEGEDETQAPDLVIARFDEGSP